MQLSFGGSLGNSKADVWTCGLKYLYADRAYAPTQQDLDAILQIMASDVAGWFQGGNVNGNSHISADAKLEWVKANYILASGLQRDVNTHVYDLPVPMSGPAALQVPWYQTLAITLRTGLKRGRAHSGRFFPPLVTVQPEAGSPYIAAAEANGIAAWAQSALIDPLNAHISANGTQIGHIAVLSPGNTAAGTTPTSQIVTGVVCDRVPDVQHRRTNRVARLEGTLALVV